jgi:hypothetical protein
MGEGALWCSSHVLRPILTNLCGERELRRDSRSGIFLLLFCYDPAVYSWIKVENKLQEEALMLSLDGNMNANLNFG